MDLLVNTSKQILFSYLGGGQPREVQMSGFLVA